MAQIRIEDITGKFIEVVGEATDVIKGLISSLKSGVGKPVKFGDEKNPLVDKLQETVKQTADGFSKLNDAIEDIPENIVKEITKEMGDIGTWVKDIRDFSEELAKKRTNRNTSAKAVSDGLNSKDLNPMEKALDSLMEYSKNTMTVEQKLHDVFTTKGSGWVHDPHVEKILKALLREIRKASKTSTASTPVAMLGGGGGGSPSVADADPNKAMLSGNADPSLLKQPTTNTSAIGHTPASSTPSSPINTKDLTEADKLTKSLLGSLNRVHRSAKYWQSDFYNIAEYGAEIAAEVDRANNGITDSSKRHEHLIKLHDVEAQHLKEIGKIIDTLSVGERQRLKTMVREIEALKEQKVDSEVFLVAYKGLVKEAERMYRSHHLTKGLLNGILGQLKEMGGRVVGLFSAFMGAKFIMKIFDHLEEAMDQTVRETGLMRSLMTDKSWAGPGEYFNELMEVTAETVDQLGQAPTIIRKAWLSAIKKGTRGMENMKDTINDALALSTAIGSNAEGTAAEFHKWSMEVGLSNRQTAVLARNIRQTSSQLGVMGDEMLKAVQSAKELVQATKDAGFNAADIADSMIRITTSGQKFGVGKQLEEINRAMTTGLDGYISASTQMKTLIAQAGQTQNVISGQVANDPIAHRKALSAIGDMLKEEFRKRGAVNEEGNIDTSKLSATQISQMNYILKQRLNIGVGEAARIEEAIKDATMTTQQRMEKIQHGLDVNNNLTSDEKTAAQAQLDVLKQQKGAETNTASINALDRITKSMESGNPTEALEKMQRTLDQEQKNALANGVEMTNDITQLVKDSIGTTNERLKRAKGTLLPDDLMDKFNKAKESGEPTDMRAVMRTISLGDQQANTLMKKNSNILDKTEQSQLKWQARIQTVMSHMMQSLGALPVAVIWLIAIAASLAGAMKIWHIMKGYAQKMQMAITGLWSEGVQKRNSIATADTVVRAGINKLTGHAKTAKDQQTTLVDHAGKAKKQQTMLVNHTEKAKKQQTVLVDHAEKTKKQQTMLVNHTEKAKKQQTMLVNHTEKAKKQQTTSPVPMVTNGQPDDSMLMKMFKHGKKVYEKLHQKWVDRPEILRIKHWKDKVGQAWSGMPKVLEKPATETKEIHQSIADRISMIATKAKETYEGAKQAIVNTLGKMKPAVGKAVELGAKVPIVGGLFKAKQGVKKEMTGIGKAATVPLAGAAEGLTGAAGGLSSLLSIAAVATGVFTALAFILGGAMQNSEALQAAVGKVTALFGRLFASIGDKLAPILESFIPIIDEQVTNLMPIIDGLMDMFSELIKALMPLSKAMQEMSGSILKALMAILKPVLELLTVFVAIIANALTPVIKVLSWIIQGLAWVIELILSPLKLITWYWNKMNSIFGDLGKGNGIMSKLAEWFGIIKDMFVELMKPIMAFYNAMKAIYDRIIVRIVDALKRIFIPIFDKLRAAFEKLRPVFEKIGAFIIKFVEPQLKALGMALEFVANVIESQIEPTITAVEILLQAFSDGIEVFGNIIESVSKQVNKAASFLTLGVIGGEKDKEGKGGGMSVGSLVGNVLTSGWSGLLGFAEGGVIPRSPKGTSEPIPVIAHAGEWIMNAKQQNELIDGINALLKVNVKATNLMAGLGGNDIWTKVLGTMTGDVGSLMAAPHQAGIAANAVSEPQKGQLSSLSMADLDERIQEKIAMSKPPAASTAINEEIAKIRINTDQMIVLATEQIGVLKEILAEVEVPAQAQSSSVDVDTSLNRKPRTTPNYYEWRQARYGDTAAKQYVNPGF